MKTPAQEIREALIDHATGKLSHIEKVLPLWVDFPGGLSQSMLMQLRRTLAVALEWIDVMMDRGEPPIPLMDRYDALARRLGVETLGGEE